MKFINNLMKGALLLLLLIPVLSLAQESNTETGLDAASGAVLAEVNLSNAELVQEGSKARVSFVVDNLGSEPQANIYYGLEIIQSTENGDQELVDTLVSNIPNTVTPGISKNEELIYDFSVLPAGEYEVWVLAQTPGGLIVGIALAGKITSTNLNGLSIDTLACSLQVTGEDTVYTINQGVDVSAEEELVLKCPVKNLGTGIRMVTPEFVTHERSVFGEMVTMSYEETAAVELQPGEEKEIELVLPLASRPQAYDLVVTYRSDSDDVVSNKAIVHYVLQGESATVQSVQFSKDSYVAGEEMELTVLWSLAADSFPESRSGGTDKSEEYYVDVMVTDKSGYICGTANELAGNDLTTLKVPTSVTCSDPTAVVSIKTASGVVLDMESVTVVAPKAITETESVSKTNVPKYVYMVIGLFAIIGVVLLLWYGRKHHNHIVADSTKSLIIVFVFGLGFLYSAGTAEAVTWSLVRPYEDCSGSGDSGNCVTSTITMVSATVNTDRTTYAPGQTIYLSGTVRNHVCSNLYYGISARLVGNPELTFFEGRGSGVRNISGTFTAPTTPGNYIIGLGVCYTNARNCASASINITVTNPAVNGRCSNSHYRCSAGNSANNRETAAGYTWSCNGISGGRSVSCSETKVNGSCGVTRNACVSGNAANGGQTSTHYTWSCNSPNGGSNASCSVAIPPSITLTPTPGLIGPGDSSNLSWTTNYATSCSASGGWSGAKSISGGTEVVSPLVPTTYILSCTGPGGTVSASTNITLPSGALSITSPGGGCTIPLGANSCNVVVNWNSANFLGGRSVTQGGVQFSTAAFGPATRTVTPDNRAFTLDDTGSAFNLSVEANVSCTAGAVMAGGSCMLLPVITVISNPDIVRKGDTAPVEVTVNSPTNLSCSVTGAVNETFTHTGGAAPVIYNFTSSPLVSARLVEVVCTHDSYPELTGSASARISVIPSIEEI